MKTPPVPAVRRDPEMENFVYEGNQGPRRRPAPSRPTSGSISTGVRSAAGPWRLYAGIVLAFLVLMALAPILAWGIVGLSHALGPFSEWYASLFPYGRP